MKQIRYPYDIDPTGTGFFWPASEQKRQEWLTIKRLRPVEAESVYQCNPGARQGVIFTDADLLLYAPPSGLDIGLASPQVAAFVAKGAFVVQAWDTAFSAEKESDYTVCVTALLTPSESYHRGENAEELGPCEPHYIVHVLDVYREKVDWGELPSVARGLYHRWHPQTVVIEKKAYGVALIESLTSAGLPIEAVMPVEGKRARAVDGVGAGSVQGWFRLHRVRYPAGAPWMDDYWREMKDFTGQKGGTDDQVDATVHLVGWAIRAGGNSVRMPTGWDDPEKIDAIMRGQSPDPLMGHNGGPAMMDGFDPFEGACGRCKSFAANRSDAPAPNWCAFHKRMTSALHACDEYTGVGDTDMVWTQH